MDSDDAESWLIEEGILREGGSYDDGSFQISDLIDCDGETIEEMKRETAAWEAADAALEHYEYLLATSGPSDKRTICARMRCFVTQIASAEDVVDAFNNDLPRLRSLCSADDKLVISYEIELMRALLLSLGTRGDGQFIDSLAGETLQHYIRATRTLGASQRLGLSIRLARVCTLPGRILDQCRWAPEASDLCIQGLQASGGATGVLSSVLLSAAALKRSRSDSLGAFRHSVERWLLELPTDNPFLRHYFQKEISDALREIGLLSTGHERCAGWLSEPATLRLFRDTDFRCWPMIVELARACAALPEAGYELLDGGGVVVAMAELAWPADRRALLLPEQSEFADVFNRLGWEAMMLPLAADAVRLFANDTVEGDSL